MPAAAVEAAFQAKLASSWANANQVVLDANGEARSPPENVNAFLVVQYPIVNGDKPVIGRRYFENGAARLVLNVKAGIGMADSLAMADTLAALFRDVDLATGVETFTPSGAIVNNVNDDINWFSLSVIVPYRYQFNG